MVLLQTFPYLKNLKNLLYLKKSDNLPHSTLLAVTGTGTVTVEVKDEVIAMQSPKVAYITFDEHQKLHGWIVVFALCLSVNVVSIVVDAVLFFHCSVVLAAVLPVYLARVDTTIQLVLWFCAYFPIA